MGGKARSRSFVAAVLLALLCAGTAAAADVGANDDTGKFAPDAGAAFYGEMASLGLRQTVVTVRWLPSDPLALGERPLLDLTVAAARAAGLSVVFATYPYPTREVEAGLARPEAFGAWLGPIGVLGAAVCASLVGGAFAIIVAARRGYLLEALRNVGALAAVWRTVGPARVPEMTLSEGRGPRLAYAVPIGIGAILALWLDPA